MKPLVYVVDGQSVDHTQAIVVQNGAAIQTPFRAVDADYVIVVNGDDTYPIGVATEMLRLLQTNPVCAGSS